VKNPGFCDYQQQGQLSRYRTESLHPKLLELACSDRSIATGIAKRGYEKNPNNSPYYGLATVLLKVLDTPKLCTGLSSQPEQVLNNLRNAASEQQD
jgi:hypothetical protein